MKIVIAPDSFKESMSAMDAACAIEKGFKQVLPDAEYVKVPMADGGEGTVRSLVDATGGEIRKETVTGPLGTAVEAFYGLTGDRKTAVIEMAAASGIHLVPKEKRNPLVTTTKGTGELIRAALDQRVERIVIGIGGSATNDGGAGMAQALGARLLDRDGNPLGFGGGELSKLDSIDLSQLDPRLKEVHIEVACDVDHPLTGKRGASAVFGPQKGATPEMVAILDANLSRYAQVVKETLGIDVDPIPGAGAAGGLGAGLIAFLGASLKRGVDVVAEAVQLDKHMAQASLVITGEGKIDGQTIHGKTPVGVAKRAKKYGVPVIGIAGMLGEDCDAVYRHGIDALFSIVPGTVSLETALLNGEKYTEQLAENLARLIRLKQMVDGTGAD
ncbi:glycerate kinase [Thermoactinomyces intermedius]|uniref:Glycerate kinase n=1 Tax=Thermoactinomyces intermedius TaxID=2024 RepID=A0A8I1AI77_THEIN|nr:MULTISPECIES: glycerate kinase [Thermoactinomyces]MBA4550108.1 glycerate kinase [Thermoactinomyces intermedius]MBA4837744.1 glycerate kinase [Thermoactinomyces intermedius]MBH8596433.1 glycerate kinase [Thermoactinomyces intermedius]MBH8602547.1 glycerate kinase [Thermoactinomyces sp. CICC 23799]